MNTPKLLKLRMNLASYLPFLFRFAGPIAASRQLAVVCQRKFHEWQPVGSKPRLDGYAHFSRVQQHTTYRCRYVKCNVAVQSKLERSDVPHSDRRYVRFAPTDPERRTENR